jgi:hypothetical protein
MDLVENGARNHCAGEGQQQFNLLTDQECELEPWVRFEKFASR